jgi:phosphoglycerate dehydrogenase-like enzyme
MNRSVIAVLDPIHEAAMERLAEQVEVMPPGATEGWHARAHGVIVRATPITKADLDAAPQLRVVGKHGTGLDNIDVAAVEAAGIPVRSTPGVNAPTVADLAVGMALSLVRRLVDHTNALRAGKALRGVEHRGWDLGEIRAGIIGVGAIGSRVAKRLMHGFDAPVSGYDPYLPAERWPEGMTRVHDLGELLAQSDMVFIHCPLTDETAMMIDGAAIARMPEGGFLINCARGGIVDEAALATALTEGRLSGAAADVFLSEPRFESPLLSAPNFVATPHAGAQTRRALKNVGLSIAEQVLADVLAVR